MDQPAFFTFTPPVGTLWWCKQNNDTSVGDETSIFWHCLCFFSLLLQAGVYRANISQVLKNLHRHLCLTNQHTLCTITSQKVELRTIRWLICQSWGSLPKGICSICSSSRLIIRHPADKQTNRQERKLDLPNPPHSSPLFFLPSPSVRGGLAARRCTAAASVEGFEDRADSPWSTTVRCLWGPTWAVRTNRKQDGLEAVLVLILYELKWLDWSLLKVIYEQRAKDVSLASAKWTDARCRDDSFYFCLIFESLRSETRRHVRHHDCVQGGKKGERVDKERERVRENKRAGREGEGWGGNGVREGRRARNSDTGRKNVTDSVGGMRVGGVKKLLNSDMSSSFSVSTNGPPPPTSHLDKKSLDSLRDVTTPDLKSGKPSDVICIED